MPLRYLLGHGIFTVMSKKAIVIPENKFLEIIDEMLEGRTVTKILESKGITRGQFFNCLTQNPNLNMVYHRAQKYRAEMFVEQIVEIADNEPDPNRGRLMVEARKWYASKMLPNKFGDKIDVNVQGTIDLNQAITEAKSRIAQNNVVDAEFSKNENDDEDIFK